MASDLEAKVVAVVADLSCRDAEFISHDDKLVEDLDLDSLEMVNLAHEVEDVFDVEVKDDDIRMNMTVGELIAAVEKLVAASN